MKLIAVIPPDNLTTSVYDFNATINHLTLSNKYAETRITN